MLHSKPNISKVHNVSIFFFFLFFLSPSLRSIFEQAVNIVASCMLLPLMLLLLLLLFVCLFVCFYLDLHNPSGRAQLKVCLVSLVGRSERVQSNVSLTCVLV